MRKPKVEVTSFCEEEMKSEKWKKEFVKNVGPNDLFFELTIPQWLKGKENEEKLLSKKHKTMLQKICLNIEKRWACLCSGKKIRRKIMEENKNNLEVGKSYPAILTDVTSEYDGVRKVYVVKFTYRVYLSATQTIVVEDIFYLWNCPDFKRNTLEKMERVLSAYNLVLIPKDYRNELAFVNACRWLVGTRVELSPYRYKGIRYKVVSTERKDLYRVDKLWKCMLNNNLEGFENRFKEDGDCLNSLFKDFEDLNSKKIPEEPFSDFEYDVDDTPAAETEKKKRHYKRKKKAV